MLVVHKPNLYQATNGCQFGVLPVTDRGELFFSQWKEQLPGRGLDDLLMSFGSDIEIPAILLYSAVDLFS